MEELRSIYRGLNLDFKSVGSHRVNPTFTSDMERPTVVIVPMLDPLTEADKKQYCRGGGNARLIE